MCGNMDMRCLVVVSLLVLGALSAPVNEIKQDDKRSVETAPASAPRTDADLQDLMKLVQQEARQDDVMVHRHEMTHIQNTDGETHKIKETDEQVVDSKTGKVLADVHQEVKQASGTSGQSAANTDQAGTLVETDVDIPAKGVHERIVQEGEEPPQTDEQTDEHTDDNNNDDEGQDDNGVDEGVDNGVDDDTLMGDLTPSDMAEFLLASQQFDLFYRALDKLVSQEKMTSADAQDYARVVAEEYHRLEMAPESDQDILVQQRSSAHEASPYVISGYPSQEDFPAQYPMYPDLPTEEFLTPEEKYITYLQQQQQEQQQEQQLLQQQQEEAELNPYDFLTALWEEAFDRGNEEAQAIVQMLYDRVSTDDNADDMGQIRDILVNSMANSFNNNNDDVTVDENIPYQGAELSNDEETEDNTQTEDSNNTDEEQVDDNVDDNVGDADEASEDVADEKEGEGEGEEEAVNQTEE